jgi:hypothetical protein
VNSVFVTKTLKLYCNSFHRRELRKMDFVPDTSLSLQTLDLVAQVRLAEGHLLFEEHTLVVVAATIVVDLQSIRGDETVNVNKPSPVSPQLTAKSGQRAPLVKCTYCIRTHVNLHSDFGHPCNGTPIT